MRLITRVTDALVNRLVPKLEVHAACVKIGGVVCGSCNRAEHVKTCCQYYDNCPASCTHPYC